MQLSNDNIAPHKEGLNKRINGLLQGELFCYTSSWPGNHKIGGHASYTTISSQEQQAVYNLGAAVDAGFVSKGLMVNDNLFKPLMISKKLSPEKLDDYLDGLIWANCFAIDDDTVERAKHLIYADTVFGHVMQSQATESQAEILQPVGNCIVKNFLFSMRTRLSDNLYRKLYLSELDFTLAQKEVLIGSHENVLNHLLHLGFKFSSDLLVPINFVIGNKIFCS